jgi:hypothetical protein
MAAVTIKTDATVIDGGDLSHPWVPNKLVLIADHGAFIKLSMMDRSFAAFCGAPLSSPHPLKDCAFLKDLRKAREDATWDALTLKLGEDALAKHGNKVGRREVLEHAPTVVRVSMKGMHVGGQEVAGISFNVLVSDNALESPSVELNAACLSFVRLGVKSTLGATQPERKRKLERAPFPDEYPVVRELANGCLYVRYKDRDGRARQKSQNPRKSDVPGIADEHKREAAKMLQKHYTDATEADLTATEADGESEHETGADVSAA